LIVCKVLKTGVTPSASGSAYLELQPSSPTTKFSLVPPTSSLKLTCTVHGPKPLPRSAPFSPHLVLSTYVKFAPFATRQRRGYIRDAGERDLGVHLETALRGVIIGDRWPKSGVDVIVTILEGEEDRWWADEVSGGTGMGAIGGWGMMSVLAGCITVASAAIVDAGIDCVDLVVGGVAALVQDKGRKGKGREDRHVQDPEGMMTVLDPCPAEHEEIGAACVVGYLSSRDEITELWVKGDAGPSAERIVDRAVEAALAARTVLVEAVMEAADLSIAPQSSEANGAIKASTSTDIEMTG